MTKVKIRNSRVEEWHNGTVSVDTTTFFEQVFDTIDATQDDNVFAEKTVRRNVSCQLASEKNTGAEKAAIPYFFEYLVKASQGDVGGISKKLPMRGQPGGPGG
jgi:ABC-type nitrate/sulfonate/bicarbonate transport system ATPase subunit